QQPDHQLTPLETNTMTMQINGHNAQGEALPKIGRHSLRDLQIRASFDARASNALVAIQTRSER
ncbi:hypothetical protein, partial [Aeromonas caviae]|uniref:hypothetical protein n=1 Tax=Aeromonas caviae TaxID=648 RepID=UPI003988C1F4